MKKQQIRSAFLIAVVLSSFMFTGCIDDIKEKFKTLQGEATKIIHPLPTCSDNEVISEVNNKLTDHALYGTHAQVKYGTILLTGTDEKTEAKLCKAVVTYSIDENDNKISSFFSKIPLVKNVSKDRTISYTIHRHPKADENLTFYVDVH